MCEKIWGGSPATERIDTGVDTIELEVSTQASDQMDMEDANIVQSNLPEQSSDQPANSVSDQPANFESDQPANSKSDQPANSESDQSANSKFDHPTNSDHPANSESDQPGNSQEIYRRGCNRRIAGEIEYKQQKLKKKISAEKTVDALRKTRTRTKEENDGEIGGIGQGPQGDNELANSELENIEWYNG